MADGRMHFELVSPERLLLSQDAEMVVVPGSEGDLGVLAGHAPVISTVRPGVISVFDGATVTARLFVGGGFVEVTAERCTVLAEEALPMEEIDRAAVEQELSDLRDDLSSATDEAARQSLEAQMTVARAKLEALDAPGY
jgi:F-type H+-transporting ATPase subunit epsilon